MSLKFLVSLLVAWAVSLVAAQAQITVSLQLPRSNYLVDEPLKATLTITNLAGREITLEDNPQDGPWCFFQVKALRGEHIPSRKSNLTFPPLRIPVGESVSRQVDLTELYRIDEAAQLRIRACVNFAPTHNQFWSAPLNVTTDSGRLLWSQTVGVPDGRPGEGRYRTFSLLTHQRPDGIYLFAKLEGKEEGLRFGCHPLGRLLSAMQPEPELDAENNLYVFHANSESSYMLSQVDVGTGQMGQALYKSINGRRGRPHMRKAQSGQLFVTGGVRVLEEEKNGASKPDQALLTDRPVGFGEAASRKGGDFGKP